VYQNKNPMDISVRTPFANTILHRVAWFRKALASKTRKFANTNNCTDESAK